tara:strand:- start:427 stop:696 length:270 start_codon:yes stop_codon:yes gene_type:complete
MGLRNTILEDGLQKLLDQCPNVILNSESIKYIIETGGFDKIISEYNNNIPLEDVGNDIPTSAGKMDTIIEKIISKKIKKPRKKKQALDK